MMMAALEEDDDYLEAEDELLNDIVSFSPDVQQAIDQVRKTDGRKSRDYPERSLLMLINYKWQEFVMG